MRTHSINQPTKRLALGACFAQGTDRLAKVRPLSGRTTE